MSHESADCRELTWIGRGFTLRTSTWLLDSKGHDRSLIGRSFAGVADGATPLEPDWPDPGPFAEQALSELSKSSLCRPGDVSQVFAEAIRQTHRSTSSTEGSPTCAVAVAWLDETRVIIGVLGDCIAMIETHSGERTTLTDPAVTRLDALAENAGPDNLRRRLRQHRALANTKAAYWIYGASVEAARHVKWRTFPQAEVKTVFLSTDGLRRVPALREPLTDQAMPRWSEIGLSEVTDSVLTRHLNGLPVPTIDDEAVVLIEGS